jgi:hypothetical protein
LTIDRIPSLKDYLNSGFDLEGGCYIGMEPIVPCAGIFGQGPITVNLNPDFIPHRHDAQQPS